MTLPVWLSLHKTSTNHVRTNNGGLRVVVFVQGLWRMAVIWLSKHSYLGLGDFYDVNNLYFYAQRTNSYCGLGRTSYHHY